MGVSVHGAHEVTCTHACAALTPLIAPGQVSVATHELVVGHQKQSGVIGAVHVAHVVKAPQFAAGAHVASS